MILRHSKNLQLQSGRCCLALRFCAVRWIAIWFVMAGLLLVVPHANASLILPFVDETDDAVAEAFEELDLNWFDQESQTVVTPPLRDGAKTELQDRGKIPLAKPRQRTGGGGAGQAAFSLFSVVAWGIGLALLFAVLWFLIKAFLDIESDAGPGSSRRKSRIEDHIASLPFELDEESGNFADVARRAYQAGDFRKAIVYLFGDVLTSLDESDLIRLQKGKTNRQYFREIRRYESLTPYYQKVMTAFEDVFFGQHEISRARVDDCFTQWEPFRSSMTNIAAEIQRRREGIVAQEAAGVGPVAGQGASA